MLTEDRQNQILRELALRGSLNAAEFARRLGISGMTVRRDLAFLDGQGLLQRVHGGAVAGTGSARRPCGSGPGKHQPRRAGAPGLLLRPEGAPGLPAGSAHSPPSA